MSTSILRRCVAGRVGAAAVVTVLVGGCVSVPETEAAVGHGDGASEHGGHSSPADVSTARPDASGDDDARSRTPPIRGGRTTYRVLIDTDLGGDPDDIQSMLRAVHYSDVLRIEGIVSSPGPDGKPKRNAELIKDWIRCADPDALRANGYRSLMTEAQLTRRVRNGAPGSGAPSSSRRTEGSDLIIRRAHAPDPRGQDRPLWVLVWGTMTTVAQALHDDPSIASKIRIYSIGGPNTRGDVASRDYVHDVMSSRQQDLFWIENGVAHDRDEWPYNTFRGVWRGGDHSGEWDRTEFVARNIRGHGSARGCDGGQRTGDAMPLATSPREAVGSLKEGDSPSMLYLLSPALGGPGDVDDPTEESWGGQFRRLSPSHPNHYGDLTTDDMDANQATINTWRVGYLRHWKGRWDRYDVSRTRS